MAGQAFFNEEKLYRFLEKHGNSRAKRELLLFWGVHPKAKFSRFAVCYAVDCNRMEIKSALKEMTEEGLLDTSSHNGISLYSLTNREEERRSVLELARLSWERRNLLFQRIEQGKSDPLPDRAKQIESLV